MSKLEEILDKIKKIKTFSVYTEFFLVEKLNMSSDIMQKLIFQLNQDPNNNAYYNGRTQICDVLGVIDIDNKRYYDFDDDIWCLNNKGINVSTKKTIYD